MSTGDKSTMGEIAIVLALGLAAGILGGFVGVGGGVLIVPVLVLALGFDQHLAVGTSLGALLPPVGILGAYEYYKHGHLNLTYALLLGLGLLIGGYIGAVYAVKMPGTALRRVFGVFLLLTSIRMLYQ
ncbi:MAG TPA: TSUP family transporter [Candidatus Acidoferrales bacterium]|nr:TSUP family transporter [Candidatus Acidoferrales bacterium]